MRQLVRIIFLLWLIRPAIPVRAIFESGYGYFLTLKPFRVSAAGTEALMINASGNIGIGTTSPSAKLEIGSGNVAGANVGYPLALLLRLPLRRAKAR